MNGGRKVKNETAVAHKSEVIHARGMASEVIHVESFQEAYHFSRLVPGTVYYWDGVMSVEDAQFALSLNTDNYRKLRVAKTKEYSRLMRSGAFIWNPDGLIFGCDGAMQQGQHRIAGIIFSGMSVPIHVTFNSPKGVSQALDCGLNRSISDLISHEYDLEKADLYAPLLKRVHYGNTMSMPKIMNAHAKAIWPIYFEAIKFAVDAFTRRIAALTCGSVKGVVARAWLMGTQVTYPLAAKRNVTNEMLLTEFCQKLQDGTFSGPEDDWIALLRRWLQYADAAGATNQMEIYQKTAKALYGWLYNEKVADRLRAAPDELFVLPTDVQQKSSELLGDTYDGDGDDASALASHE
jgi:hypothetical protein